MAILSRCCENFSTLIANTGNTQGIKFKIRPPNNAAPIAHNHALKPCGVAFRFKAGAVADGVGAVGLGKGGHAPLMRETVRNAASGLSTGNTTNGKESAVPSRCTESGSVAFHTPLFHACTLGCVAVAGSTMFMVSANTCSVLPCHAAGRPSIFTASALSTNWACAEPFSNALGVSARLAANAAPLEAVEPLAGIVSTNCPSCGTHSWRHTNHEADKRTSTSPVAEGIKPFSIVSGTGSNTVSL